MAQINSTGSNSRNDSDGKTRSKGGQIALATARTFISSGRYYAALAIADRRQPDIATPVQRQLKIAAWCNDPAFSFPVPVQQK